MRLYIDGKEYDFPAETKLMRIADELQKDYADEIIIARVNGKLQELYRVPKEDSHIAFLTTGSRIGHQVYERSAILMLLKAIYAEAGTKNVERVQVLFALGDGLYIETRGHFDLDEAFLERVSARMHTYVEKKYPITKHRIPQEKAKEIFESYNMNAKARLLKYRSTSQINIYALGRFEDYFYGYMAPNASYIRWFQLQLYKGGFLLRLPDRRHPATIPPFSLERYEKLYQTLKETSDWNEMLGVRDVASLNEAISQGRLGDLILIQEALQEKKIAQIAEQIAANPDKRIVMIAGPSSSGKTSFSHRLAIQLAALGLHPHPIEVDNYFVEREKTPKNPDGTYNFESLGAMDIELLNENLQDLLAGKEVDMPKFNFVTGKREYKGDKLKMGPDDVLIIEGIHCLNDKLTESLPRDKKFKIYISALSQLSVDDHNRIPTTDGRLIRRIVRDARTRGASASNTINMWPSVRAGEEENIFPFQNEVDATFNSGSLYELAVLKPHIMPLLYQIEEDDPAYLEAKRLLKFLNYFLGVDSTPVPNNSLIREFIGGSCFNV